MPIRLGSYAFDGPFRDINALRAQSGVYAVLGMNSGEPSWRVLDVGESADVRARVSTHDRSACWARQGKRELACAAWYADEPTRMRIEQELRARFNPPCGQR